MNDFGTAVREARERMGMTQAQLAAHLREVSKVRIAPATIGWWESGRGAPRDPALLEIVLRELNLPRSVLSSIPRFRRVRDMLEGSGEAPRLEETDPMIARALRDPQVRQALSNPATLRLLRSLGDEETMNPKRQAKIFEILLGIINSRRRGRTHGPTTPD